MTLNACKVFWIRLGIVILFLTHTAFSETLLETIDSKFSSYVDLGQFRTKDKQTSREFINRTGARWNLSKKTESSSFFVNLQWLFWRNQALDVDAFHIAGNKFDAEIETAYLWNMKYHNIKLGMYKFKYNSSSNNLGEYLLRTEAYPTFLESSQGVDLLEASHTRIVGGEYGLQIGGLKHTLVGYFEQEDLPAQDVSIASIWNFGNFGNFEQSAYQLGGGIAFHRVWRMGKTVNNSALSEMRRAYIEEHGIQSKALKFSIWGSVGLHKVLAWENAQWEVYSEIALLGTKSDSLYYTSWKERAPAMFGMNASPLQGLEIGAEVEYLKNPYRGTKYKLSDEGGIPFSPLPNLTEEEERGIVHNEIGEGLVNGYHQDDWKWNVYAKIMLNQWVDVNLRVANDHLRLKTFDKDHALEGNTVTQKLSNFYFLFRIEWHN